MFRHIDVVCVCLVCFLWQFSMCVLHDLLMLVEDARGDHMEAAYEISQGTYLGSFWDEVLVTID